MNKEFDMWDENKVRIIDVAEELAHETSDADNDQRYGRQDEMLGDI